jgi:hypothetical protein
MAERSHLSGFHAVNQSFATKLKAERRGKKVIWQGDSLVKKNRIESPKSPGDILYIPDN